MSIHIEAKPGEIAETVLLPISIQGTGMGIPSISIYVHELIKEYGVKNLIRVGTCGCIQKNMNLGQVLLAIGAGTDSATNNMTFSGLQYAPTANYHLLAKAYQAAESMGISCVVGNIYSTDLLLS